MKRLRWLFAHVVAAVGATPAQVIPLACRKAGAFRGSCASPIRYLLAHPKLALIMSQIGRQLLLWT
jgi:hypothetical protein